jgi:hypothetical protein
MPSKRNENLQRLILPSRRVYILHVFNFVYSHARRHAASFSILLAPSPPVPVRRQITPERQRPPFNSSLLRPPSSGMDGASSSASSSGYRPRRGVRLRPLRRRRGPASSLASRGGDGDGGGNGGGGAQDDLALPLGMSFAAVLARVRA